jgi:hypothetical protein
MPADWGVSIRRACQELPFDTSSYHYQSRRTDPAFLKKRIKEICASENFDLFITHSVSWLSGHNWNFPAQNGPEFRVQVMMKLVVADSPIACSHRLNTLAITRPNQNRNIGRTHPPTRPVPQRPDKRRQPCVKVILPTIADRQPPLAGSPWSRRRARHNHRSTEKGIPKSTNLPK